MAQLVIICHHWITGSQDAKKAHGVEAAAAEVPACGDDAEAAEAAEGVRVEIEESDEETTEAAPVVAVEASGEPLHSLERLNKKEPGSQGRDACGMKVESL